MNRALTQLHSRFGFFIDPSSRSLIYKPASADKVRGGSAGVLQQGFSALFRQFVPVWIHVRVRVQFDGFKKQLLRISSSRCSGDIC